MNQHTAYLLLGSNLDNRLQLLETAVQQIAVHAGTIQKRSGIYETAAWGNTNQQAFLNMSLEIETTLNPESLLNTLIQIELGMGRQREEKWGPRLIDIDILFYDNEILGLTNLIIPHPYLHERRFTLIPLAEITPGYTHPILHKTVKQLLEECKDKLEVKQIS